LRNLSRLLALFLVAGMLAAAPVAASTTSQGTATATSPTSTTDGTPLSTAKVAVIVGATGSATSNYRDIANSAYATAIQYSSNVVKVFSPTATWAAAKAAMTGASVVIYLGHGNGWPSPYTYDPSYTTKDGLGLNSSANNGDSNTKYYGEPSLATVDMAPNAVVLLNHLCYASGNSEPQNAAPTLSVAKQRADNYGQGFIKAGARAVIAEGHGSINGMIRDLFTTHQSILALWRNQYDYHHNEFSFQSMRNAAYDVFMDPDTASGGYYRSLVGNPDIRTEDVTGVPFVPTDTTPDSLQTPGAATVAGDPTLYDDSSLTSSHGSLADGAAVRVQDVSVDGFGGGSGTPAAYIKTLDGSKSGWMADAGLAPQDSLGPQLWSLDGSRTVTPNGDGVTDTMSLSLHFSESVAWSAAIRDAGGHEVWSASGSSATATLKWDAKVSGAVVANGLYHLALNAHDEWGNAPLSSSASLTIDSSVLPTRIAGADRYATAAAISKATYAAGVPVVYIANGLGFADALAGAAAAGKAGGPLLTIPGTSIPAATAAELTRLKPAKIIVLGGTSMVSQTVLTAMKVYIAS
jgi:hypothetical protein